MQKLIAVLILLSVAFVFGATDGVECAVATLAVQNVPDKCSSYSFCHLQCGLFGLKFLLCPKSLKVPLPSEICNKRCPAQPKNDFQAWLNCNCFQFFDDFKKLLPPAEFNQMISQLKADCEDACGRNVLDSDVSVLEVVEEVEEFE